MSDERDVSNRYRELPREEPPRALDEAILAASRRAVRPSRSHWMPSLALAALLVLVVGVTLHLQTNEPDAGMAPPRMEVQKAPPPPPAAAPARRAQPAAPAASSELAQKPAEPPRAAPAPAPTQEAKVLAERRDAAGAIAGARESRDAERSRTEAVRAPAPASPERELERIAKLRADGKDDEADKALAEFRKRYPDYRIPPAILEKVEKK